MLLSFRSYELHGCQVLWAIKDDAIGNTFFDKGAATFFLPHLESSLPVSMERQNMKSSVKRMKYGIETPHKFGQYKLILLHYCQISYFMALDKCESEHAPLA